MCYVTATCPVLGTERGKVLRCMLLWIVLTRHVTNPRGVSVTCHGTAPGTFDNISVIRLCRVLAMCHDIVPCTMQATSNIIQLCTMRLAQCRDLSKFLFVQAVTLTSVYLDVALLRPFETS